MAPIGSERSSTRVASAGAAGPSISNDGMAHLVKAVLVNLQVGHFHALSCLLTVMVFPERNC